MSDPDVGPNAAQGSWISRWRCIFRCSHARLSKSFAGKWGGAKNIARIANWPESIRPHHSMFFHQILGLVGGTYNIGKIKQMEKSEVPFNSCFWHGTSALSSLHAGLVVLQGPGLFRESWSQLHGFFGHLAWTYVKFGVFLGRLFI